MVENLVMVILALLIIDSTLVSTLGNHKALKVTSQYTWQIHFQIKQIFSLPLKISQDHYYLFANIKYFISLHGKKKSPST